MKHNNHCPQCHSDRVRRVFGTQPGEQRVPAEPPPYGPAAVTRYECRGCGYAEEWVESREGLAAIRRLVGKV